MKFSHAAFAATIAIGLATGAARAQDKPRMEKCYGVALTGIKTPRGFGSLTPKS